MPDETVIALCDACGGGFYGIDLVGAEDDDVVDFRR